MHDLNKRATDLAACAKIMLVIKQGGHPLHFFGQGRPYFQFAKNHRAGLGASPRCHRVIVLYGFHPNQTETKRGTLSRIFSKS